MHTTHKEYRCALTPILNFSLNGLNSHGIPFKQVGGFLSFCSCTHTCRLSPDYTCVSAARFWVTICSRQGSCIFRTGQKRYSSQKVARLVCLEHLMGSRSGIQFFFPIRRRTAFQQSFFSFKSVTIIVLLFLVKFTLKSPRNSEIPEWDACDRPLGVWAALWLIRVVLASSLSYWEFRRARQLCGILLLYIAFSTHNLRHTSGISKVTSRAVTAAHHLRPLRRVATNNRNRNQPQSSHRASPIPNCTQGDFLLFFIFISI